MQRALAARFPASVLIYNPAGSRLQGATRELNFQDTLQRVGHQFREVTTAQELQASLDPEKTHVFLCGNPSMIGLPTWTDEGLEFPETLGVCQQLHERGFVIDHRKERGNVHYEEYWTDR